MNARRRESAASFIAPPSTAGRGPPRVHRQLHKASRFFTADAIEAARRQRQLECQILAQIVTRAQRLRERTRAQGKTPFGRPLDEEDDGGAQWSDAMPLTLIELIQASSVVLEKHAIQPPEEATYHRYLLTLSMDPERDWKTKIQRFAVSQQPRVTSKRMSITTSSTTTKSPSMAARTAGDGVVVPPRLQSMSIGATPGRRDSVLSSKGSTKSTTPKPAVRRHTAPPTSTAPPAAASIVLGPSIQQRGAASPLSPSSGQSEKRSTSVAMDRFSDMLSTSDAWKIQENRVRHAAMLAAAASRHQNHKDDESAAATMTRTPEKTNRQRSAVVRPFTGKMEELLEEQPLPEIHEHSDEEEADQLSTEPTTPTDLNSPSYHVSTPLRKTPIRSQLPLAAFQCLATFFQQWKEITTFQRLLRDSRKRALRLTQSILPPIATFALFRWIALTLPRRQRQQDNDEVEEEGDAASISDAVVPLYISQRGISQQPQHQPLLVHFMSELRGWTLRRIVETWANDARNCKMRRIHGMLRARTRVLEMASLCLHQWRIHTRRRKRVRSHAMWVEALAIRQKTRITMKQWRTVYHTQQQINKARWFHRQAVLKMGFQAWRTSTNHLKKIHKACQGKRLQRMFSGWKRAVRCWQSDQNMNAQAVSYETKTLVRRTWDQWRLYCRCFRNTKQLVAAVVHQKESRDKRVAWQIWRAMQQSAKSSQDKCVRFTRRRTMRFARRVVVSWAVYTHRRRRQAVLLMDRASQRNEWLVERVWKAWVSHWQTSTKQDEQRVVLWDTKCRLAVWRNWKKHTGVRRSCALFQEIVDRKVLDRIYRAWKQAIQKRVYHHGLVDKSLLNKQLERKRLAFAVMAENWVLSKHKHRDVANWMDQQGAKRLQHCVTGWRGYVTSRLVTRHQNAMKITQWRSCQLLASWAKWRHAFHVARCCEMARQAMAHALVRKCFAKWHKCLQKRHQKRLFENVILKFRVRKTVFRWQNRVSKRKTSRLICKQVALLHQGTLLTKAWHVWRHKWKEAQIVHRSIAQAIRKWQNGRLVGCFSEWKLFHTKRKHHRAVLCTWWHANQSKSVKNCWTAWRAFVSTRHVRNGGISDAKRHFEMNLLVKTLQKWKMACLASKSHVNVLLQCLDKWNANQNRVLIKRWRVYAQNQRKARHFAQTHHHKLLKNHFLSWVQHQKSRKTQVLHFADATTALSQWVLQRAVHKLRLVTALSKRLKSLSCLLTSAGARGRQMACLQQWKVFITHAKTQKMQFLVAKTKLQAFRTQKAIQKWISFTKIKQMMTKTLFHVQNQSLTNQKRVVFAKWKHFLEERHFRNALQQKAIVFRVFCLVPTCFEAWKLFISNQKKHQMVLLKAAQLMSHHREARAFKTWVFSTKLIKQTRQAVRLWQNQTVLNVFTKWKTFQKHAKNKQKAVAFANTITLKRNFGGWKQAAHHQKLLKYFKNLWMTQTTEKCFLTWKTHTKTTKCAKKLLHRIQNTCLNRVWNTWKAHTKLQIVKKQQIQFRFGLLWDGNRKMTSFQRWKTFVNHQKQLKKQIARRFQHQMTICFQKWKVFVQKRRFYRTQALKIRAVDTKRILCKYLWAWQCKKSTTDAVQILRHSILTQNADLTMKNVFFTWRRQVRGSICIQKMLVKSKLRMISCIWKNWKVVFVGKRRKERQIGLHISTNHDLFLLRRVFMKMQARLRIKRVCLKVFLPQIQRELVSNAWLAWIKYHIHKQSEKRLVLALQQRLLEQQSVKQVFQACGMKWKFLAQAKSLFTWHQMAQDQIWVRAQTCHALRMWQLRQWRHCFTKWHNWTSDSIHIKKVDFSFKRHFQKRFFTKWRAFHVNHRSIRSISQTIATKWTTHTKRGVFHLWEQAFAIEQHFKQKTCTFYGRVLHRLFMQWHTVAIDKKARRLQQTVAKVAYQDRLLKAQWNEWTKYVANSKKFRQELQKHTERLQILVVCSCFRAWQAWCHRQKHLRAVCELFRTRRRHQMAWKVVHAWAHHTTTKARHGLNATTFFYGHATRRAIQALRKNAMTAMRYRQVTAKASHWMVLLQSHQLAQTFTFWKAYATQAKKKQIATNQYTMRFLLPHVWKAWLFYVRSRTNKSDRLSKAVRCWKLLSARRAWNNWVSFHVHNTQKCQAKTRAQKKYQVHLLQKVVLGWRTITVKKKVLQATGRHLILRWKMQNVYKCFANWLVFARQRKAQRATASVVARHRTTSLLGHAWRDWRKQYAVCHVGTHRQLHRLWTRWVKYIQARVAWRQFQETQCHVLLTTVKARQGLRQWQKFMVQAKLAKTMALLSSRFSKEALVKKCFEKWLAFLVTCHKEKQVMARVLNWMQHRHLVKSWQALQLYVERQKHNKATQRLARDHDTKRTKKRHFQFWSHIVQKVVTQRAKLTKYVDVMQHLSQRRSFLTWRDFADRHKQLKKTYAKILSQRTLLTTQCVFACWGQVVTKQKRAKMAQTHFEKQLYRHGIRSWRRFLILSRIERMLGASALRTLEQFFVAWRKRTKILQQVGVLRGTKMKREQLETVTKCFTMWKQWSKLKNKCSRLLRIVSVGNHLRFRFWLWKMFTSQRAKLRKLTIVFGEVEPTGSSQNNTTGDNQSSPAAPAVQLARMARVFHRLQVDFGDLSSVWQRWRHIFHARLFYRLRREFQCFSRWLKWSHRQKCHRQIVASRGIQRTTALLQRVFQSWHGVVVLVKQIQNARRRERELWVLVSGEIHRKEKKTMQRHWTAWRSRVEQKRHLVASVLCYERARVLTKFWLLWAHDFVKIVQEERFKNSEKRSEMNKFKAKKTIEKWLLEVRRSSQQRDSVETISTQRQRRWYGVCLHKWAGFAQRQRSVRHQVARRRQQRLHGVVDKWCLWMERRRQQMQAVDTLVLHRKKKMQVETLIQWLVYVRTRRLKEAKMDKAVVFHLHQLIHKRWRRVVHTRVALQLKSERVGAALAVWRQRRVVSKWHRHAHQKRLQSLLKVVVTRKFWNLWKCGTKESIAVKFAALQMQKRAKKVLFKWHTHTQKRHQRRSVLADATYEREKKHVGFVWLQWVTFAHDKCAKRLAVHHYDHVVQLKWLLHWLDAALAWKQERAERLQKAAQYHARGVKKRALRGWIVATRKVFEKRAVVLMCMAKLRDATQSRLQQVVFVEWSQEIHRLHCQRECVALLAKRRVMRAFRKWRQWLVDHHIRQRLMQDAGLYHRNRLVSVVFFHWQNYAFAWKDAQKARARTRTSARQSRPRGSAAVVTVTAAPHFVRGPQQIQLSVTTGGGDGGAIVATYGGDSVGSDGDDGSDSSCGFRHPLSPIAKRHREKRKRNKTTERLLHGSEGDEEDESTAPPLPSLLEAATLSLDVKKRLLLLGKWKPTQKSFLV